MKETLNILFGLFGGLAIFIFGMNMMSECLQKAAGERKENEAVPAVVTRYLDDKLIPQPAADQRLSLLSALQR